MRPNPFRQKGQAMAEFVIVAVLFLIPVFLMVPTLGKYIDMKAEVIQGARYAAWERTVWYGGASASPGTTWPGNSKTDDEIRNELRARVFSEGSSIQASDKSARDWTGSGAKAAWYNRDGSSMLDGYDSVTQSMRNDDTPGIANDLLNLVVTVTSALGTFNLEMKGLQAADVSVTAKTLPIGMSLYDDSSKSFNPGPLTFSDHSAVLSNTWSANGADHVKSQTQGLTPTSIFANPIVKTLWTAAIGVFGALAAPELLLLEIGKVEPDVVPPDRLVAP
jgi:hypothetical protein